MNDQLAALLQAFPVLYINESADPENPTQSFSITKPENYEYVVGVTLDYIPEDKKWYASYGDFIESHPFDSPYDAVNNLWNVLKALKII
nr:MAG TPA: hypothetical protein [Crassvirales sp.]